MHRDVEAQVRSALREMLPPVRESTLYFADRLIDAKSLDLDAEDVAAMLAVSYLHGFEDTMGPRQNWPPAAEELARESLPLVVEIGFLAASLVLAPTGRGKKIAKGAIAATAIAAAAALGLG